MSGKKGQSGRRPDPVNLWRMTRSERLSARKQTVTRPSRCPKPPVKLSPGSQAVWDDIAHELWRNGLLTELDTVALTLYCDSMALYIDCCEQINRLDSPFTLTTKGTQAMNPLYRIRSTALRQALDIGGKFGLSPMARLGVRPAPKPEPADPFERIIADQERNRHSKKRFFGPPKKSLIRGGPDSA